MPIKSFNWFAKITGYPVQLLLFRTKITYEDKKVQSRYIKGPAMIISNHIQIFDYVVYLFVFWSRTLRFQMAEVLFKNKHLARLLKRLGGIYVDRKAYDFGFIQKSIDVLENGGVVGAFPESRLPLKDEKRPLEFKTSAAYIALATNVPIIPVYTNGSYFKPKRARVIIGKPIYPSDVEKLPLTEEEKVQKLTEICRNKIIELGKLLDEQTR